VAGLLGIAAIGAIVAATYASSIDTSRFTGRTRTVVEASKERPLAAPDLSSIPPGERVSAREEIDDASTDAFRLGIGVAAGLVAIGGALSGVLIRNPRREVRSADCAGGQLAGAPGMREPAHT
jgi:hypothetical protein